MNETTLELITQVPTTNKENIPTIVIRPTNGWVPIDLRELWEFRDLLYFFTWRDIKIRYKQAALGFAWVIIQPFLAMVIFTVFFGNLAKLPSDGIPYPIFAYAALLPWTLFSESIIRSTNSMVANSNILTKVYFPRLVIPISSVISPVVDFGVAFTILILMMAYYGIMPTVNVLFLPVFILMALVTSLGIGLWTSALNARYRDVQYVMPFLIQLWMYASPVVYSATMIPTQYRFLYGLNPMAGVIEGFRWSLLGTEAPDLMTLVSVIVSFAILASGAFYFRRMEKTFADEV